MGDRQVELIPYLMNSTQIAAGLNMPNFCCRKKNPVGSTYAKALPTNLPYNNQLKLLDQSHGSYG